MTDYLGSLDIELKKIASPMAYLNENMSLPPFLILHGDKDHVVPITQSIELYEKLKEYCAFYNNILVTVLRVQSGK